MCDIQSWNKWPAILIMYHDVQFMYLPLPQRPIQDFPTCTFRNREKVFQIYSGVTDNSRVYWVSKTIDWPCVDCLCRLACD